MVQGVGSLVPGSVGACSPPPVQAVTDAERNIWVVYYAGDADSTGIYCAKIEL